MHDPSGTNRELLEENDALRRKIKELEFSEAERRRALGELDVIKCRLSRAEIISRSGNWEFDLKLKRVFASEGARKIYGISEREWTIPEVQKVPLPEYRGLLDQALLELVQKGRPYDVEFKIRRPDTGEIADIHSVAEYDPHRKVVFGILQDITERKRAEEELRWKTALLEAQVNTSIDGILVVDGNHKRILSNRQFVELWNIPEYLIHEADDATLLSHVVSMLKDPGEFLEKVGYLYEHPHETSQDEIEFKSGKVLDRYSAPVADEKGHSYGRIWVFRDITERKQAEEALMSKNQQLLDIINFLPDATLVIDRKNRVIAWNKAMETMTGVKAEEMLGKDHYEYAIPFYGERRPILVDMALGPVKMKDSHYTALRQAGSILFGEAYAPALPAGEVFLSATASVLRNSRGEAIAAIECIRDITEHKRIEARLNRAEKMEALGTLAGGVAHDLNNVLGVLVGYSELLVEKLQQKDPLKNYAQHILKSSERGASIIQDLLTMARRGVSVSDVVNLNKVVTDYLESPEHEKLQSYHEKIRVKVELADDLLNIKGSPVHLGKTVMNLVSNAAEAIPGAGTISIRTENRYLDYAIDGYDNLQEGDYALLSVSDTGVGIPAKDIGKIFEPFYTKKVMGRSGTGLGLAVVWGTMKDHHGYIDVKSGEGAGSTFTLYFPVTREGLLREREKRDIASYKGRGESILVIDDMEFQRELADNLLTNLNYEVHTVSSGEEAVSYLRTHQADLLLLDMIMDPGIDGLETFRRIREIKPDQKAVIVSGFAETERVGKAQELGAGEYVRKPYSLERIGLAIRRELDRK
ncbi:PAS domain S-box-containing protein [Syntrophus gentianae]|uniref:histidine kinase n=1 Tax=Syntrophus gentianae TaxID=43775 RepID=A0A1H7WPS4_9BACT|nr:PAS domain S-box protein [Syntrophus gentianae]SEM23009.1 PAS domain S-box-containing protein [Syntrophus gentianae]